MTDKLCCPECGTHIDEHEAGECIDAWAAKDVMKWEHFNWRYIDSETKKDVSWYAGDFAPSKRIAAAWVLVEKVADLHGCQFSIERVGKPWEIRCGKYGAVVSGGDLQYERPDLTLAVYADSAPLALTRAAIKATAPHG